MQYYHTTNSLLQAILETIRMASRQYTISTPVNPNCFLNSHPFSWYLYYSTGEPLVPSWFLCQLFPGRSIIDFLLGIKRNTDSSEQLLIMEGPKAQTMQEQQLSTINPQTRQGEAKPDTVGVMACTNTTHYPYSSCLSVAPVRFWFCFSKRNNNFPIFPSMQFLSAAEGQHFVKNNTLVEREPELRMQPACSKECPALETASQL